MMSPLECSGRWSPYHRNGNSCSSFPWCSLAGCFIHESGNGGAVVTVRRRARDSAEGAEPMCALSRRQSLLREEGKPREAGGLAEPLAWCPLEERSLAEGKTLGEARQAWRASPGLESLVLSNNLLKSVVGPGRPARGTLVSTVPTVAPGPTMGTPKSSMEAKR